VDYIFEIFNESFNNGQSSSPVENEIVFSHFDKLDDETDQRGRYLVVDFDVSKQYVGSGLANVQNLLLLQTVLKIMDHILKQHLKLFDQVFQLLLVIHFNKYAISYLLTWPPTINYINPPADLLIMLVIIAIYDISQKLAIRRSNVDSMSCISQQNS